MALLVLRSSSSHRCCRAHKYVKSVRELLFHLFYRILSGKSIRYWTRRQKIFLESGYGTAPIHRQKLGWHPPGPGTGFSIHPNLHRTHSRTVLSNVSSAESTRTNRTCVNSSSTSGIGKNNNTCEHHRGLGRTHVFPAPRYIVGTRRVGWVRIRQEKHA